MGAGGESTCRSCPEAHLSTSQRHLLCLSLSLSVSVCPCSSITSFAYVSFLTHLSLCHSALPFLHFTKQITLTWVHVRLSLSVSFTFQQVIGSNFGHSTKGDYCFILAASDQTQNSNKLWRFDTWCVHRESESNRSNNLVRHETVISFLCLMKQIELGDRIIQCFS